MKALAITMFMLAVAVSSAFATAQFTDVIVYEGKKYGLQTNPMEAYFAMHPDKKTEGRVRSTALWRGYMATFEIKTNDLVLKDIEILTRNETENGTSWRSVKDDVVPGGKVLLVDWFT